MDKFTMMEAAEAIGGQIKHKTKKIMNNVVIDNREVNEGSLFFAIKGDRFDGHEFIDSAFENGAAAVVSEKLVLGKPHIEVEDTKRALLDFARFNRKRFKGPVVGVTGSVGKTTTKEMVSTVLEYNKKVLKTIGNLNNAIGLSKTLFGLSSEYEIAVVEMGMSDLGEISALSQTTMPTIGLITNIGVSHIENLGSRENILKAKLEITDGMQEGSPLIVCADDDKLENLIIPGYNVITCAVKNKEADYVAENIVFDGLNSKFDVINKEKKVSVSIPALGEHNVLNALFSFAVGSLVGMDMEDIAKALKNYKPAGMRQKTVEKDGVTIIADCYNASPDSMKASLGILSQLDVKGKKIAVLGEMLELGKFSSKAHEQVGEIAKKSDIDTLFIIGEHAKDVEKGACGISDIRCFSDKDSLKKALEETVKKGDAVLFKASRGIKLETIIEDLYGDI